MIVHGLLLIFFVSSLFSAGFLCGAGWAGRAALGGTHGAIRPRLGRRRIANDNPALRHRLTRDRA